MVSGNIIFSLILFSFSLPAAGQQRLRPLMERVVLLQAYMELTQQGYHTLNQGWSTVQQISRGEWDLHTAFFDSQQRVSTIVKQNQAVDKVRKDQQAIIAQYPKVMKLIAMPQFRRDEQIYFRKVAARLIEAAATDLHSLNGLLTNGYFRMRDAERLKRIHELQISVTDTRKRFLTFYSDLQIMAQIRSMNDNDLLKKFYR